MTYLRNHCQILGNIYIPLSDFLVEMANINQTVWNLLEQDRGIQKDLLRGIVNTRALARYLMKNNQIGGSLDAVISAVRRYEVKSSLEEEEAMVKTIFKNALISTKSNISCLTLPLEGVIKVREFIRNSKSLTIFKIVTGITMVKIIEEEAKMKKLKEYFNEKEILKYEENLSEITITLQKKAMKTKGILARIAGELAVHDVNIEEIVVANPEILLYIKDKHIIKAHETIMHLVQ
jgi:hypothetical protein